MTSRAWGKIYKPLFVSFACIPYSTLFNVCYCLAVLLQLLGKVEAVSVHAIKVYVGSEVMVPPILNLGTKRDRELHIPVPSPQWKRYRYASKWRLEWTQRRSACFSVRQSSLPLSRNELLFFERLCHYMFLM